MRLPRMTTRRWMVVVAVVGILSGISVTIMRLNDLKTEYLRKARRYKLANLAFDDVYEPGLPLSPEQVRRIEYGEAMTHYNGELSRKYERAASRPWVPVEPDPLPPEPGPLN